MALYFTAAGDLKASDRLLSSFLCKGAQSKDFDTLALALWVGMKEIVRLLATVAVRYLWVPANSADAAWSSRHYGNILTEKQQNVMDESSHAQPAFP